MNITWSFDGKEYVSDFGGLQGLTYVKAVTKENAPATVSGEIVIEYVVYEEPSVSNNGSASANNLFDGNRGTYATLLTSQLQTATIHTTYTKLLTSTLTRM